MLRTVVEHAEEVIIIIKKKNLKRNGKLEGEALDHTLEEDDNEMMIFFKIPFVIFKFFPKM